ncbi:MAG: anti-sigma factor family protein [Candidatus Binatia bacterium]
MTCEKIRQELVAYRDSELLERDRARVAEHLSTCRVCTQEEAQLARVSHLLTNLERVTPSPDFVAAFRRRLAQEDQVEQESRFARWWREWLIGWQLTPALAGAASLLVFLGYILSGRPIAPPQAPAIPGVPAQVAKQSEPSIPVSPAAPVQVAEQQKLFVDYKIIANLDRVAHFDEIVSEEAQTPETVLAGEEELPPTLLKDPSFFTHYPILQRMEKLQNMEAVLTLPAGGDEQHQG